MSLLILLFFVNLRWTAAGTLQAKYHSKMAGMNAPIARPKGTRKLKSSAEDLGTK